MAPLKIRMLFLCLMLIFRLEAFNTSGFILWGVSWWGHHLDLFLGVCSLPFIFPMYSYSINEIYFWKRACRNSNKNWNFYIDISSEVLFQVYIVSCMARTFPPWSCNLKPMWLCSVDFIFYREPSHLSHFRRFDLTLWYFATTLLYCFPRWATKLITKKFHFWWRKFLSLNSKHITKGFGDEILMSAKFILYELSLDFL